MVARPARRFGVLVRRGRVSRGITTRELARKIGVSNGAITNWEKARLIHPLDPERVRAVARALGLDGDALLGALVAEHFVNSLPEPLLKAVRRELLEALETLYEDGPVGRGLSQWEGDATDGRATAEGAGEPLRTELVDALLDSGHLDARVAGLARQGGPIPAREIEVVLDRLMNPSQLTDLLLILGATLSFDFSPRGIGSGDLGTTLRLGTDEESSTGNT